MQIDQNSTTTINAKLAKDLTEGKFYVLLGGDGNLYTSAMYEIKGDDTPEIIFVGDVNGDTSITIDDIVEIAKRIANMNSSIDNSDLNYYAAAYCTGDIAITTDDIVEVAKRIANMSTEYVGQSVASGYYGEKSN